MDKIKWLFGHCVSAIKPSTIITELNHSKSLDSVKNDFFDCVYLAGGHATMYDFPGDTSLQFIISKHYEGNKIVADICHGVGGLLNVKLNNGEYLIKGKSMTGFNWFEEAIARRRKEVPFNLEAAIKERGADLKKIHYSNDLKSSG